MTTTTPTTTTTTTTEGMIQMTTRTYTTKALVHHEASKAGWSEGLDQDATHVTFFSTDLETRIDVRFSVTGAIVQAVRSGLRFGEYGVSMGWLTSRDRRKFTALVAWFEGFDSVADMAHGHALDRARIADVDQAHAEALEINQPYQIAAPNGWYSLERRNAPRNADGSLVRPSLVDSMNALDRAMAPKEPRPSLVDSMNALDRAMAPIVRTGPANEENEMSEMIGKTVKSVLVTPFTAQDTYGDTITGTRTIISFTDGSEFTAADLDIELFNFEEQAATISPALAHQALAHQALMTVTGATTARWER